MIKGVVLYRDQLEDSGGKTIIKMAIVLVILVFINLYLIFISDTVIESVRIFYEEGFIESNTTIPRNLSIELFESSSVLNRKTNLLINGSNISCTIINLNTNETIALKDTVGNYEITLDDTIIFYVVETSGNLTYRYEVYSIRKPYLFLSIIVFIISLIGLTMSVYLFINIMIRRMSKIS